MELLKVSSSKVIKQMGLDSNSEVWILALLFINCDVGQGFNKTMLSFMFQYLDTCIPLIFWNEYAKYRS